MLELLRYFLHDWRRRRAQARQAAAGSSSPPQYFPACFDAVSPSHAMFVAVNPAPDMSTEQRWTVETQNLVSELRKSMALDGESRVLDYGCGMGRVSKALIESTGCSVVGVDISPNMRALALTYVNSDRFAACDPETLDRMVAKGYRATHACACWVLQHCKSPSDDIARIESALVPGGDLFVLNSKFRWLPVMGGWARDDISVEALLAANFGSGRNLDVSSLVVSHVIAEDSYALLLKKRG